MPDIGPLELVIIIAIALLVFGPGKLGDVGGALGRSLRSFRDEMDGKNTDATAGPSQRRADACSGCGSPNVDGAKYCTNCGAALAA